MEKAFSLFESLFYRQVEHCIGLLDDGIMDVRPYGILADIAHQGLFLAFQKEDARMGRYLERFVNMFFLCNSQLR